MPRSKPSSDTGNGTAHSAITVNYRALKTVCTFVPGASGEFELVDADGVDPTDLVDHEVAQLTGWSSTACGITSAKIQILDNGVTVNGWSRGAIHVLPVDPGARSRPASARFGG